MKLSFTSIKTQSISSLKMYNNPFMVKKKKKQLTIKNRNRELSKLDKDS